MDSVALFLSREHTLNLIQSLKESRLKCEKDGRKIMAKNYAELEKIMRGQYEVCLLYTSPSPRDGLLSRMPSSA